MSVQLFKKQTSSTICINIEARRGFLNSAVKIETCNDIFFGEFTLFALIQFGFQEVKFFVLVYGLQT